MGGELNKSKKDAKTNMQLERAKTLNKFNIRRSGRKKGKISLPMINAQVNNELKVMELIQDKNPKKMDYNLIYNCIEKHSFLQSLKSHERNEIIVNMSLYRVKPYKTLYYQGSIGNFWFIVLNGQLDFIVDGVKKRTYGKGDNFGEISLMNDCPQIGTVKTVTECELWALKKEDFEKIKDNLYKNTCLEATEFLKSIKLPISDDIKFDMVNSLVKNIYKPKDIIYKEGESSTCIYIIKEGEVNFVKNGRIAKTSKKYEYFGENGLFEGNKKRDMDATAKTNCIIYTITYDYFQNLFDEDFKEQLNFTLLRIAFSKSVHFRSINSDILNAIFKNFIFKTFRKNNVIFKKDLDLSKKMCVVLDGNIIEKGTNKIVGREYQILFEDNIAKENEFIIKNDLIAESNCIIAEANYQNIKTFLGDNNNINNINKSDKNQISSNEMMVIQKIKLFSNLDMKRKELIQKNLKIEKNNNGVKILIREIQEINYLLLKKEKWIFSVIQNILNLNTKVMILAQSLLLLMIA